ncbi:hypothetical protein HDU79_004294 [Rhizoclosmatium sp. JEL0117]|nr:hypothetical protein HDU79_004294 [Rhizoclosmatium sp. JEL0117]
MRRFASVTREVPTAAAAALNPFFLQGSKAATRALGPRDVVFEAVDGSAASSSLVQVTLRPTSRFIAATGAAVAVSQGVESRLTTLTAPLETAVRLATAPFRPQLYFSEFWTAAHAGSVFLAPPRSASGEIGILRLGEPDGREVVVKREAFLAVAGDDVVVKTELNADGLSTYRIFNTGTLAIASPEGALHRISLAVNEEILVDPDMLVAWDAGIHVKQTVNENNAPLEPAPRFQAGTAGEQVSAEWQQRFAKAGQLIVESAKYIGRLVLWKGKNAAAWSKGMYRLKGPGDFYLASRRRPTLSWLKQVPPAIFRIPKSAAK